MYVCICMYVCIYIYVCMYVYVYIYVFMSVCVCIYIYHRVLGVVVEEEEGVGTLGIGVALDVVREGCLTKKKKSAETSVP